MTSTFVPSFPRSATHHDSWTFIKLLIGWCLMDLLIVLSTTSTGTDLHLATHKNSFVMPTARKTSSIVRSAQLEAGLLYSVWSFFSLYIMQIGQLAVSTIALIQRLSFRNRCAQGVVYVLVKLQTGCKQK